MDTEPILEITDLTKNFGGVVALAQVNLLVMPGQIASLIGPNGAGNTSFFNAICGLVRPTEGEVLFDGDSELGLDPHQITEMGIARTFQNVRLFPNMTVGDY